MYELGTLVWGCTYYLLCNVHLLFLKSSLLPILSSELTPHIDVAENKAMNPSQGVLGICKGKNGGPALKDIAGSFRKRINLITRE